MDQRLVGLNGLGEIGVDEPCFTLTATEKSPHVSIIRDAAVWAHILNASEEKDNSGKIINSELKNKSEFGLENFNNPLYQTLRSGGPFTDDYGNTIFVKFEREPALPEYLYNMGYFGEREELTYVKHTWDEEGARGGGWHGRWYKRITGDKNIGGVLLQRLENEAYVNKSKVSSPIVLTIDRVVSDWSIARIMQKYNEEVQIFVELLGVAGTVFPGINTAIYAGVKVALEMAQGFFKDGSLDLSPQNLTQVAASYAPEGSPLQNYLYQGSQIASALSVRNYGYVAQQLGININTNDYGFQIEQWINDSDILQMMDYSNKDFDTLHKLVAAVNNSRLPEKFKEQRGVLRTDDVTSDNWKTIETMVAGGGIPALPTIEGQPNSSNKDHLIPDVIQSNKSDIYGDVNLHRAMINLSQGLPVDPNSFDEILLENLDNKLSSMQKGQYIVLPANLSPEKRECFAKHLKNKGIDIIIGNPNTLAEEQEAYNDLTEYGRNLFANRKNQTLKNLGMKNIKEVWK